MYLEMCLIFEVISHLHVLRDVSYTQGNIVFNFCTLKYQEYYLVGNPTRNDSNLLCTNGIGCGLSSLISQSKN